MRQMRVLWTHNFDPATASGLVFVKVAATGLRALGVDLHLEYIGNLRSISNMLQARRHVRQLAPQFDLVHAQYGSACALVTTVADGIPKVVSIRGNDWNIHSETLGFLYVHTRLARLLTRWSLSAYDCVLAVSDRLAAELRRGFPRLDIVTLPSAIDLARFVPREKDEARKALGYSDSTEKWVLFTALNVNDPIKRFGLAKRAVDIANARGANIRLRVATDLPHERLPVFAAACDLILCTSETEGWPNSVKEALACNIPFVSTDVSDLAEIARQEPTCRICPPDAEAIARIMCELLAMPNRADLRKHVSHMSLDTASRQLADVYERLLSRRRVAQPVESSSPRVA